jgi:SAM-dependent methyltransferase
MSNSNEKNLIRDFWDRASCGEELYLRSLDIEGYRAQSQQRYALEPFIEIFARFEEARDLKVLEIGVGLGADHQRFAEAGADLTGIDLTRRAVAHVARRFVAFGLPWKLVTGDAENLPFKDGTFDIVYAWGVIHHSPDTAQAAREILRVLKPGGHFRVMIYHTYSMVGAMLWLRYALLRLRPLTSLAEIYAKYLESPGTKAFTTEKATALFSGAEHVRVSKVLTHGDLLTSAAGQRHHGLLLTLARRIWPRALIRRLMPGFGLFLLIEGCRRNPDRANGAARSS